MIHKHMHMYISIHVYEEGMYVCMYSSFSLFIVLKNEGKSMKYDDTAFHTSNYVIAIPPPLSIKYFLPIKITNMNMQLYTQTSMRLPGHQAVNLLGLHLVKVLFA